MSLPRSIRRTLFSALLLACLALIAASANAHPMVTPTPAALAPEDGGYAIVGWNNLGMHCYDPDFSDLAILPPFNTLWAQVIQVGDPPMVVGQGITLTYVFTDNTYSVLPKSNFWDYAQGLFGLSEPLPDNVGLAGKGLAGTMDLVGDHFEATGIPLTEFRDSDLDHRYPFQTATVVAYGAGGTELARQVIVAPVSTELMCVNCHCDDCDATTTYPISPTGKVETNILAIHDYLSQNKYPPGHTGPLMDRRPVLCAECHPDNALGLPGLAPVKDMSNAMHAHHANLPDITPDTDGCYNCHPGPETRCLRDAMAHELAFQCPDCHGLMADVAQNPYPWLREPRCDNPACHGSGHEMTQALYRESQGHGNLYCPACHDSPHALALSREPNDAIKFVNLQGTTGTLRGCEACHGIMPAGRFAHSANLPAATAALHLSSAEIRSAKIGGPVRHVTVTGIVHDQDQARTAGVAVTGTWTYPDGSEKAALAISDQSGQWIASVTLPQCGLYQFDLTDLFLPGFTYNAVPIETSPHTQLMISCD
jgi:hypothetical protein